MVLVVHKDVPGHRLQVAARLHQGASRRADIRQQRPRLGRSSRRLAVQEDGGRRPALHPLPHDAAGHRRPDRRPHLDDLAVVARQSRRHRRGEARSPSRWPASAGSSIPELPTFDELGLKDYEITTWVSMYAPKDAPPEVAEKLTAAVNAALADPEVQKRFDAARHRQAALHRPGLPEEISARRNREVGRHPAHHQGHRLGASAAPASARSQP